MTAVFGDSIRRAAALYQDRTLLREESGRELTYRDFDVRTDAVAASLLDRGCGVGSVVALTLPSGIDYLIAYGAAAKLGAITAGINPSLTEAERTALLAQLGPNIVVDEALDCDEISTLLVPELPAMDNDAERIVAIVFTSGTTGLPKGAIFRNRQLAAIAALDLGPTWNETVGSGGHMFASTQFAHVGFMTKLPWYLHAGLTLHCLDRWRADSVLRLIDTYRIETLGVVAPQLAIMLRSPLISELDLRCVRTIIAGGAASSSTLITDAIAAFDAHYSVRYSSTESGGVGLATAPDASLEETLHTVGRPRPGVDIMIVDSHGLPVSPGETGELRLRTPTAFDGYWRNPVDTAATLVDGWICTGDLARLDEQGHVRITGRLKEMYIRGGYNVAPAEVEAVLHRHPKVREIAIGVRPDDVMGEIGVAVCVADEAPTLAELRTFGQAHLASWKLPEDLIVVEQLPLTAMQKLDRAALNILASSSARPTE